MKIFEVFSAEFSTSSSGPYPFHQKTKFLFCPRLPCPTMRFSAFFDGDIGALLKLNDDYFVSCCCAVCDSFVEESGVCAFSERCFFSPAAVVIMYVIGPSFSQTRLCVVVL